MSNLFTDKDVEDHILKIYNISRKKVERMRSYCPDSSFTICLQLLIRNHNDIVKSISQYYDKLNVPFSIDATDIELIQTQLKLSFDICIKLLIENDGDLTETILRSYNNNCLT